MGCCNQPPKGGGDLTLALKVFGVIAIIVIVIVAVWG